MQKTAKIKRIALVLSMVVLLVAGFIGIRELIFEHYWGKLKSAKLAQIEDILEHFDSWGGGDFLLRKRALEHEREDVRIMVFPRIASLKDPRVVSQMIKALDKDSGVSYAAAEWFANRDFYINSMSMHYPKWPEFANAVPRLISIAKDNNSGRIQPLAIRALGWMGDSRAVQPIIEALKKGDENVCYEADMALEELKDKSAVEPLLDFITNNASEENRSSWAGAALSHLCDDTLLEKIIVLLDKEKLTKIRVRLVNVLGRGGWKNKHAYETLLQLTKEGDTSVRNIAIISLRNFEFQGALKPLTEMLRNDDAEVRKLAVNVLMQFKDEQVIDFLKKALTDEKDESVRETINKAIDFIDEKRRKDLMYRY